MFVPGSRFFSTSREVLTVDEVIEAGTLRLPSGHVIAWDPTWLDERATPFTVTVPPGEYPVQVASVSYEGEYEGETFTLDEITAARLVISAQPTVSWELAVREGQDIRLLRDGHCFGFGVDSATGSFADAVGKERLGTLFNARGDSPGNPQDEDEHGVVVIEDPVSGSNLIAYPSGMGDGSYPVWIGRDADGEITSFVADMLILNGAEIIH
jgi:hypothetical protein